MQTNEFHLVLIKQNSSNKHNHNFPNKKQREKMKFTLLIAMIAIVVFATHVEATTAIEEGMKGEDDKKVAGDVGQMKSTLGRIRGLAAPVIKPVAPYIVNWCKDKCFDDDNYSGLDKWKKAHPGKPLPPKYTRPRRTHAPRRMSRQIRK